MKLLAAGATLVTLGLLTAGCSGGSGSKAAAASSAGGTSATSVAAASPSAVTTSATAGPAGVSSAAAPTSAAPTAGPAATANPPASATTTSAAASAPGPKATGATAGGKTGPVAVCTTLPTAQVASLSGRALTSSREQDFAADNSYTCGYFPASGVGGLNVTVKVVGGQTAYANTLSADTIEGPSEHATTVTGFGDKAFSAQDGVHALFGDQLFTVAGVTAVQPAEAIIQALRAKLQ